MQTPITPQQNPQAAEYEQSIPAEVRLRNGQYYTPPAVCDLMLALSKPDVDRQTGPMRVLEPGCGPGSFLLRLANWLESTPEAHPALPWQLHGIELDANAAQLAQVLLASASEQYTTTIHTLNFISPEVDELGQFDWIFGNPPYVRQEHLAQSEQVNKKEMLSYLSGKYATYLERVPAQKALFTQTADLYLLFFLQATTLLKPGGRLAFITSNSWLNTSYGQHFQQFLTHHFHVRHLVESTCERWFADAAINSLITVLERKGDILTPCITSPNKTKINAIKKGETNPDKLINTIRLNIPLNNYLPSPKHNNYWTQIAATIDGFCEKIITDELQANPVQINRLIPKQLETEPFKGNWAIPLRAPVELLQLLGNPNLWQKLEDLGQVRYPLKTGINAFFYLNREKARQWGIEAEFLFPVLRSSRQVKHYNVEASNLPDVLFSCPYTQQELAEKGLTGALAYVQWGETQNAPPRQKRAQPIPWPQVPSIRSNRPWHYTKPLVPAHLLCPRFIDQRFFFPVCQGEIMEDQTFYGFTITQPENHPPLFLAALLNSTLSYLLVEFSGRTNLGEGVLQFARCDMAGLSLINPDLYSEAEKNQIIQTFQALCKRPILPLAQELESPEREALDSLILKPFLQRIQCAQSVYELRKKLTMQLIERVQERQTLASSTRRKSSSK